MEHTPPTTPHLFYGNFDFEETLAKPRNAERSNSTQQLLTELAPLWIAVAQPGDVIWCPQPVDPCEFQRLATSGFPLVQGVSRLEDVPGGCKLIPWGWTEEAARFAKHAGARCHPPPLDAVCQINSRAFSHAREKQSGSLAIPVQEVSTIDELLWAVDPLADSPNGCLVKAEFSNSSRQRYRYTSGRSDIDQLRAWAGRRLRAGQRLYVEPWLDRLDEVGVQWDIPLSGEPDLIGVTGLLTDAAGQFCGCDFTPGREEDPRWQPVIEATRQTARDAQSLGYFGPLGIDAMCYQDTTGQIRYRAFQDINARWTIGRISLALRSLLNSGERGRWYQGPRAISRANNPGLRTVFSSPKMVGGKPTQLRYAVMIDKTS